MSATLRTFVAFELPEPVVAFMAGIQQRLKSRGLRVRWVRPQNIHLTLKFFGNIDPAEVEKISSAMAAAAGSTTPLALSAKGVGVFPGIQRARVIWVGLAGQTAQLAALQKTLDDRLQQVGFAADSRTFQGHLTLGRFKARTHPRRLVEVLQEFTGIVSEPFTADALCLFKSDLQPAGAVYSKLKSVSLYNSSGR